MKRVGIVGSRTYTNRRKIKEFVFSSFFKEQFGEKVEVVSGGQKRCRWFQKVWLNLT